VLVEVTGAMVGIVRTVDDGTVAEPTRMEYAHGPMAKNHVWKGEEATWDAARMAAVQSDDGKVVVVDGRKKFQQQRMEVAMVAMLVDPTETMTLVCPIRTTNLVFPMLTSRAMKQTN